MEKLFNPDFQSRCSYKNAKTIEEKEKWGFVLLLQNKISEILFVLENSPTPRLVKRGHEKYRVLLHKLKKE